MDYLQTNRTAWDQRTKTHVKSKFYDVKGFLAGSSSLQEIELAEMPDATGKKLLHLQCHFGMDTLSWARRGAIATGVDVSPEAIKQANALKEKAGLEATFVCSDVYKFGEQASPEFDIVFTSYGTVNWMPCVQKWAQSVSASLRPDGRFYMADFHPVHELFAGEPYFGTGEPYVEDSGTYTENCTGETSKMITWFYSISDIVNALIDSGIRIDRYNEFPFSPYKCFDNLEEREPGRFYQSDTKHPIPLVFSITGTKTICSLG